MSANETERLFPVADSGQRAHDFRDDRSGAEIIRLRLWGKAIERVGASFGSRPVLGSLGDSGANRHAIGRREVQMGEHRPARVHPSGEKQHLKRHGHRVGAVIACGRREDRERLVRMSSHQVAGHLHAREVVAGELAGLANSVKSASRPWRQAPAPYTCQLSDPAPSQGQVLIPTGELHRDEQRAGFYAAVIRLEAGHQPLRDVELPAPLPTG